MRSVSRVYFQWKQAWELEQKLNEQKHRALLFWALELQKKVLFYLFFFIIQFLFLFFSVL